MWAYGTRRNDDKRALIPAWKTQPFKPAEFTHIFHIKFQTGLQSFVKYRRNYLTTSLYPNLKVALEIYSVPPGWLSGRIRPLPTGFFTTAHAYLTN